jgi:hypothetical protein
VRLIGIGLEELGVEAFVEGKFWDGGNGIVVSIVHVLYTLNVSFPDLFIDGQKQIYKDMNYKRCGVRRLRILSVG